MSSNSALIGGGKINGFSVCFKTVDGVVGAAPPVALRPFGVDDFGFGEVDLEFMPEDGAQAVNLRGVNCKDFGPIDLVTQGKRRPMRRLIRILQHFQADDRQSFTYLTGEF